MHLVRFWHINRRAVAAQLFDMVARMSTSVSIAGFACRICRRALRRYRPDDESGS
jgi:hypothetical protein